MKIYISADIEGVTGVASWDETNKCKPDYQPFADQMLKEVQAACEGVVEAGAHEIWIKDAHSTGRNLTFTGLPQSTRLIREFSGHPYGMMQEIDGTFTAAIMVGYHSFAGSGGSPLAHSFNEEVIDSIRINDCDGSEFLLNAYTAAYAGVPVVFVCGDEELCEHVKQINGHIRTVAVKRGVGSSVISLHPEAVLPQIKEGVRLALGGEMKACLLRLPEKFKVEISFIHHYQAYKASFYPGMKQVSPKKLLFETGDYFEVLRMKSFIY